MTTVECIVRAVNIRSGPSTAAPIVSSLTQGMQATVDSFTPHTWLHVTSPHAGYFSADTGGGVPTVRVLDISVPPAPSGNIKKVKTTVSLNVRTGPGTSYPVVATLSPNQIMPVFDNPPVRANNHDWLRLANGTEQWIAVDSGYVVSYSDPAPAPTPAPQPTPAPYPPGGVWTPGLDPAWIGGHGNPSGYSPGVPELDTYRRNNVRLALIPAYNHGQASAIAALRNTGVARFILRAAIDGYANALDFANRTWPIIKEFTDALGGPDGVMIVIGNEPNLYEEGLGITWKTGSEFASWWLSVASIFRTNLPGCKLGFAPMSPGGNRPDVGMDERTFVAGCAAAIASADWVAVHNYWTRIDASDLSVPLTMWRQQFGSKPLVITETGPGNMTPVTVQAIQHAHAMYAAAGLPATFWIIDSSNDPRFSNAGWLQQKITLPANPNPLPAPAPAPTTPPVPGDYLLTTPYKTGVHIQQCYDERMPDGSLVRDALIGMYQRCYAAGRKLWTRVITDIDLANELAKVANVIYRYVKDDHEFYRDFQFYDEASAVAAANAMYNTLHEFYGKLSKGVWLQFVNEAEFRPFDWAFNIQMAKRCKADGYNFAGFGDATANRSIEEWVARNKALDYFAASAGQAIVVVNGYGYMYYDASGHLHTSDHLVSTPDEYVWFGNWMQDRYKHTSSQPYVVYAESQTSDSVFRGATRLCQDLEGCLALDRQFPWLLARLAYTAGRSWGHREYQINEALPDIEKMILAH